MMGNGVVRNEVLGFSLMMEKVLQRNDFKGGWHEMSTSDVMNRIYDEVRELNAARKVLEKGMVSEREIEAVKKEAIDVANFCMMMVDILSQSICPVCRGAGVHGGLPDYACRGTGRLMETP